MASTVSDGPAGGSAKPSCTICDAGYHRYGTTDPEHEHSYTACINQLRGQQERLLEGVKQILDGIDRTELDDEDGWWETFTGADLGAEKLREIEALWRP